MCWRSSLFSVVIRSFVSCQRHHQCTPRNYKTFVHFKTWKKWSDMRSSFCVLFEKYFLFITFKKNFIKSCWDKVKYRTAFVFFPIIFTSQILMCIRILDQILATPVILTRKMTCHAPSLFNTPLVTAPRDSSVMNT